MTIINSIGRVSLHPDYNRERSYTPKSGFRVRETTMMYHGLGKGTVS